MGLFRLFATIFKKPTIELEDITARIDPELGFHDLQLKIVQTAKNDVRTAYVAMGVYKGATVGLQCEVVNSSPAGMIDQIPNRAAFIGNGALFRSIGAESDRLIAALSELYGLPTTRPFTKHIIPATTFPLHDQPVDISKPGYCHFKLFLAEDSDDLYSEIFLNIDTENMTLELAEKDSDYRENIITIFTA